MAHIDPLLANQWFYGNGQGHIIHSEISNKLKYSRTTIDMNILYGLYYLADSWKAIDFDNWNYSFLLLLLSLLILY